MLRYFSSQISPMSGDIVVAGISCRTVVIWSCAFTIYKKPTGMFQNMYMHARVDKPTVIVAKVQERRLFK